MRPANYTDSGTRHTESVSNDAILAATVRATGGKLYCLNTRHYPMDDILVEQAWTP